jgi:hypothetical protein
MKHLDRHLDVKLPIQSDEIERRCRLVSLVYEVLRDMETPAEETTNTAILFALSRAFLEKATKPANRGAAAPAERRQVGHVLEPMERTSRA